MSYALLDNDIDQLCSAMTTGDIHDMRLLIGVGVNVDSANTHEETALHVATCLEKVDVVVELLKAGADPNMQNKNGQTALHLAAANGYEKIVALLLAANADIDMKTFYTEMTALHLACQNGHTNVVDLLIQNGADTSILDAIYQPAIFYAEYPEIKKLLKDHEEKLATERQEDIEKDVQRRRDLLWKAPPPPYKSSVHHKQKFSENHRKHMELNVFDRLTKRKSQAK